MILLVSSNNSIRNRARMLVFALAAIFIALDCTQAKAQVGPDAYKPVTETKRVNGKLRQLARKPVRPYEAYKYYKFDSDTPISGRSDVRKIDEIQPPVYKKPRLSSVNQGRLAAGSDYFAIELQHNPRAQGYIVVYRRGNALDSKLIQRGFASAVKDYLMNARHIDSMRLVTVDGGTRAKLTIEFWIDAR